MLLPVPIVSSPDKSDKIAVTIPSLPHQARVFINDKLLQQTTDTKVELPAGEYSLRLELDDYEPFEGKIGITEQRRVHKVTLNKVAANTEAKNPERKKDAIDTIKEPVKVVAK